MARVIDVGNSRSTLEPHANPEAIDVLLDQKIEVRFRGNARASRGHYPEHPRAIVLLQYSRNGRKYDARLTSSPLRVPAGCPRASGILLGRHAHPLS
jgi:hypothetical protein